MMLLFKWKTKKACIGKPIARQREREREKEKRRYCDQCCRVDVKEKVDGTILGVILFRLSENSILMDEISENIFNEELNNLSLVKIQFRENYYDLEIQNLERGNSEYALIESRRELEARSMITNHER